MTKVQYLTIYIDNIPSSNLLPPPMTPLLHMHIPKKHDHGEVESQLKERQG